MRIDIVSLAIAISGWIGFGLYHLASLPSLRPPDGSFILLILPYIFIKAFTGFASVFFPLISMVTAMYAIYSVRTDKVAWKAIIIGSLYFFVCLLLSPIAVGVAIYEIFKKKLERIAWIAILASILCFNITMYLDRGSTHNSHSRSKNVETQIGTNKSNKEDSPALNRR
ncbi:hypothetical protein [Pelobacter propionicus]|uniref:Uncharacterized protein n=1 Tax=Pelobacter propionicus (strain DSM 2379 / NBRC 103807 / OttBd1) TaxID=338966 RepID=A1AQ32_PELPD|nr:hypothetical protein [Pelobacter propionicus]ABK99452.1 hypothetical protein Ppro_1840 [Pelobacter propionicus DSM 2379]